MLNLNLKSKNIKIVIAIITILLLLIVMISVTVKQTKKNSSLTPESIEIVYKYTIDSTPVFSSPDDATEPIYQVEKDSKLAVYKSLNEEWYIISNDTNEKELQYVQSKYLSDIEPEPETEPTKPAPYYSDDGQWLIVDEEVLTEGNVWTRNKPNGEKIALLEKMTNVHRTGIGENGWSRIILNDQECYVATYYLYPVDPVEYTEKIEWVKVTEDARVRASGSINSDQVGWAIKDMKFVRVGTSIHGWSQIIYKNEVRYLFSEYIVPIEGDVPSEELGNYQPHG